MILVKEPQLKIEKIIPNFQLQKSKTGKTPNEGKTDLLSHRVLVHRPQS